MQDLDFDLDNVVIFELPEQEHVNAFRERLRPRWGGWSDDDEHVWLFSAQLAESADLAPLLREAQLLLAELGVASIRVCLDGRVYDLEAGSLHTAQAA
jgi:hypothetical protein